MPNWRAVLAGFLAFLVGVYLSVAYAPPYLFVVGFLGGAVAGGVVGGFRSGLWHGLLAGFTELLVVAAVLAWLVFGYDPQHAYPGIGYSIVFLAFLGLLYVVQATVAGAVAGFFR